jgi:hypothetical protein
MSATTQITLRAARDRLVDLLGIGETYPLQDVAVSADRLTVAITTSAKISIAPGQTDVTYVLRDHTEKTVSAQVQGTGAETVLTTPAITEDQTFRIFASKIDTFASKIQRQGYLNQAAEVKVGLDTTLNAYSDAPLLDPRVENPPSSEPRIVDYGAPASVKVELSQEGVDYNLVILTGNQETVASQEDVRGNLATVVLISKPLQEDVELRVRATKRFDPKEGRQDQTALLDARIPLMVRARTDLAVAAQPSPSPYGKDAQLVIGATQLSAYYAAYVRTLGDTDFVYGLAPDPSLLPVSADIQVPSPSWTAGPLIVPDGYVKVSDYQPGTGGDVRLTLPAMVEDSLVIVEARKEHGPSKKISSVRVQHSALVLVQPNPSPPLTVEASVDNNALPGPILVGGGQPGVFYYFRAADGAKEILAGAYFHKLDAFDPTSNKGVNQLRIGIDLVLARDPSGLAGDRAHTPPPLPLLDLGPQSLGINLFVRAMKARTGIDVQLPQTAQLPPLPVIKLDSAIVPSGTPVKIVITGSVKGESYQPFLIDGTPVATTQDGTGSDIAFTSQPIQQSTRFLVRVTRPGSPGIAVTRAIALTAQTQ